MHRLMKENTAEADINPGDAENMFHKPSPVPLPLTASSPIVGSFLALSPSALVCPPSQGCSLTVQIQMPSSALFHFVANLGPTLVNTS